MFWSTINPEQAEHRSALPPCGLIARLSEIIRNDLRREENVRQHIEKKLRQKIVWKMELHGQKMG